MENFNPCIHYSYWIFTNKNGEKVAYKTSPETYNKYLALYGRPSVPVVEIVPEDCIKIVE